MKRRNAHHGPPIDAYIVPDTDEHQVINNSSKMNIHNDMPNDKIYIISKTKLFGLGTLIL